MNPASVRAPVSDALAALRDLSADTLALDEAVHVRGVPRDEVARLLGVPRDVVDARLKEAGSARAALASARAKDAMRPANERLVRAGVLLPGADQVLALLSEGASYVEVAARTGRTIAYAYNVAAKARAGGAHLPRAPRKNGAVV